MAKKRDPMLDIFQAAGEVPPMPEDSTLYEDLLLEASTPVPTTPAPTDTASLPTTPAPSTVAGQTPPGTSRGEEDGRASSDRGGDRGANHGTPDASDHGDHAEESGQSKIHEVPEGRKCVAAVDATDFPPKRCGLWTVELEPGVFDKCCFAHSQDPKIIERRAQNVANAGRAAAQQAGKKPKAQSLQDLIDSAKTQDDIERCRQLVGLEYIKSGGLAPARLVGLAALLDKMSAHIERYGAIQGAEGGHSYMRLIPGVDIVEYEDPQDACLSEEDIEKIDAGVQADVKAGVPVPEDIADCILKYCGRKVRRREKSRYAT